VNSKALAGKKRAWIGLNISPHLYYLQFDTMPIIQILPNPEYCPEVPKYRPCRPQSAALLVAESKMSKHHFGHSTARQ
jgi:hypothetical protein